MAGDGLLLTTLLHATIQILDDADYSVLVRLIESFGMVAFTTEKPAKQTRLVAMVDHCPIGLAAMHIQRYFNPACSVGAHPMLLLESGPHDLYGEPVVGFDVPLEPRNDHFPALLSG